jgi:predicted Fe-Mo cluster-binding NifX family protein
MRIAVSADSDQGLEAGVSQHFGRCQYFTLVDAEGPTIVAAHVVQNPYYPEHVCGAVTGFIHQQKANVMLTGGMGQRVIAFFDQLGIQPVTGASGTVKQAVESYLAGEISGVAPCHESTVHAQEGHQH